MAWSLFETLRRWRDLADTKGTFGSPLKTDTIEAEAAQADADVAGELALAEGEKEIAEEKHVPPKKTQYISIIKLHGSIEGDNENELNFDNLKEPIEKAFKKKNVSAVILDINCPGGSPVEADRIARKILRESERKNIPVFAFISEVGASGGYWIACAADYIYAMPDSVVGSIGVISDGFGFDKLIAKLGIERRIYTAGEHKSKNDPYMPVSEADIEKKQEIQGGIHDHFKEWVRERRGKNLYKEDNPEELIADEGVTMAGDYWLAQDATDLGLIDGVYDMEEFLEEFYGDDVQCEEFSIHDTSFFSRLFSRNARGTHAAITPQSIGHALANSIVAKIKSEARWSKYKL